MSFCFHSKQRERKLKRAMNDLLFPSDPHYWYMCISNGDKCRPVKEQGVRLRERERVGKVTDEGGWGEIEKDERWMEQISCWGSEKEKHCCGGGKTQVSPSNTMKEKWQNSLWNRCALYQRCRLTCAEVAQRYRRSIHFDSIDYG